MTTSATSQPARQREGISRRTVVVGTAWAVPAVVVADAAPALAASGTSLTCTPDFNRGTSVCRNVDANGQVTGYEIHLCATLSGPCAAAGTTINVRQVWANASDTVPQSVNETLMFSGSTTTECDPNPLIYQTANRDVPAFTIGYLVNGTGQLRPAFIQGPFQTCFQGAA